MVDADPATQGSKQMLVSGNTILFPTNGRGGTQATAHPNFPANGTYLIEGFTVAAVATGPTALQVFEGDGTTQLFSIQIAGAANPVLGQFVPIGGVYGYCSDTSNASTSGPGISAKLSTADATFAATLWFRRIG